MLAVGLYRRRHDVHRGIDSGLFDCTDVVMIPRRREFPSSVKREAFARSAGICECHLLTGKPGCGVRLGPGNVFYEHIVCDRIGGTPTLDNCAALCRTCWRLKTNHYDLPIVADTNRMWDRHRGIKTVSQRIPGGKLDPRKRKMNGQVVDRETGEPRGTR
jgi:5-methylcytosine-specific restriction enzyme A